MNPSQRTLDAVAAALVVVDRSGRICAVNTAFTMLTGWMPEAVSGAALSSLCDDKADAERLLGALLAGSAANRSTDAVELMLRHADGAARLPVLASARPASTSRLILTLVDCGREHDWKVRAERTAEALALAQEFGRFGIWERDLRTGRGRWDRLVYRFWGLQQRGDQAPTFAEALRSVLAEDRDALDRIYRASLQRAGSYAARYRVRGADGAVRRLHSQWIVRNGADETPARVQGVITDDSEVWHLAQSFSEAQDQLRLAVELGRIAIWRHDLCTERMYFSDVGWRTLGLPARPDGIAIDEFRRLIHPDDDAHVRATRERALASDAPVDMQARYRHSDGRWLDVLTRRVAQRDENGQPIGFIGVAMDVSEREGEQRRLQELTRRLDMATSAAGVAVWAYDVQRREAHWNAQMYALHGLAPESPAPDWPEYVNTYVRSGERAWIERRMRLLLDDGSDRVTRAEMRIVRSDGAVRELSVRARALRVDGTVRVIGTMVDVTDQRAEQRALREAHARVALAARAVGFGVWQSEAGSDRSTWDEQMWRLRGLEPRGPVAPSYEERMAIVHPDDLAALRAEFAAALAERRPWSVEYRVRWPDGSWHWLASRSTPVQGDDGRELRRFGINWDITDARNAEASRQARLAAQRESQAKSAFMASMSHELRTPLHAVMGFAQLLLADPLGPPVGAETRERIGHIRAAGQHLLALVDDVLELSSLDAGELRLESRCLSLRAEVDSVLPMVAASAQARGVSIEARAVEHAVQADPTRLRQVLLNLLTNAVKYNRRGGRVELASRAGDPGTVVIAVRDSGRGMSAEQLAHVFEPFNRLGVEREGIEGTGIGLAIVKINAERMGGAVRVSSEPGVGSCFEVHLPLGRPEREAPHAAVAAPVTAADPRAPARTGRVLYIEDNPVNALIVRELLAQRRDLQLDEAADGTSGLQQARATAPDLILLDMQLPDIDGLEVLRRLRAEPTTATIPCIALSANAMPDDIQSALSAGFTDYWTKPLDFRVFMNALDSMFGKEA